MKLVVFAGAGFSVPFGYPTMDSFLTHADGSQRLSKEDKSLLGSLVLEARRANSFLESSPTNLEDILTFSEMGDRLGLTKSEDNRSERLRHLVRKVFTTATPGQKFWAQFERLQTLTGRKASEATPELAFITTNYDLNIECACLRAGWFSNPGFAFQRFTEGGYRVSAYLYNPQGLPLYKLHGSVNWYSSGELGAEPLVEDRVVHMSVGSQLPLVCAGDYVSPHPPVVVPPSFLKPEMSAPLREVWGGAAKVLSEATVVAFVGYSFPPSDTEMMYFLARALSENAGLRRVWVIAPDANEIVQRLRDGRSKMGSHFKSLIRPVPSAWQESPSIQDLAASAA